MLRYHDLTMTACVDKQGGPKAGGWPVSISVMHGGDMICSGTFWQPTAEDATKFMEFITVDAASRIIQ